MMLPLTAAQHDALFVLIGALTELGLEVVLVGGLVPPLLIEALEPGVFMEDVRVRQTNDCDLAVAIGVGDAGRASVDAVHELLASSGWTYTPQQNPFRWVHDSNVQLDMMPVPAGIEASDGDAIAVAQTWVKRDTALFYRGYELALVDAVIVEIDVGPLPRALRIAGLLPVLAMKLQAWTDRPERRKDAHDVAMLLRFISVENTAAALRRGEGRRPDLVREVLARLHPAFTDPWGRGVDAYALEAFPHREQDATEPDRNAVVEAARRLLEAMGVPRTPR